MRIWEQWKARFRLALSLPRIEAQQREHEARIQELERELDLGHEPSEFGNRLQRRRHLELLKDTPLSEDEVRAWESGT